MKRVKAACICQTLHFMLKDGIVPELSAGAVQEEVTNYKSALERNHTKYRITEETLQPDGSVILKIIRQYNQSATGEYLD